MVDDDKAIVPYEDPDDSSDDDAAPSDDSDNANSKAIAAAEETSVPKESATSSTDDANIDEYEAVKDSKTESLEQDDSGVTRNLISCRDDAPIVLDSPPRKVKMHIRETNGIVEAPAAYAIIVGRRNSTLPVDIDLASHEAIELGISRQHLRIEPRGKSLVVKDLNSVNGTRLNREEMIPGHFYYLNNGDELKLGRMHIKIEFVWD